MLSGRDRLKDWIERSAFKTQREAAGVLSLHPVVLSQILTGVRKPELGNAVRIEQVTGISVESWLHGTRRRRCRSDCATTETRVKR